MALTNYPLLSLHDAVDATLDAVLGGDASPRSRRMAIKAVKEAYDELPVLRPWRYFYRTWTFATVASQTSGTITYTASSRTVTLASSTWPSDVVKYALYIAGARYTIETRTSSTVIVLSERDCPTANVAAGTSYVLARDTYELPDNVRQVVDLYDLNAPGGPLARSEPADILFQQRTMRGTTAMPSMYGVYRSELYASAEAVHFAPSPSSARTYQAYCLCWPLPLKTLDYSVGTVATTADSATVTGTSTVFSSDHVGAVIRFSSTGNTAIPTDLQGEIDKNRLSPYAMQRVIKSRESTTSLTLEQTADTTLSGSGYRISSRIDIEPGSMRNAFLRCCEARFATQDRKGAEEREDRYQRALVVAKLADQRLEARGGSYAPHDLAGIASSVELTTGGSSTSSEV